MTERFSATLVGAFVLLTGLILLSLVLWLGTDRNSNTYTRYSVYFDESVAGLSRHSRVSYRGVEVGRVAQLGLAERDPRLVHAVLELEEHVPIDAETTARLRMRGVTGSVEIELSGATANAPPPPQPPGEPYPVIEPGPSLSTRFEEMAETSTKTLAQVAAAMDVLLTPENLEALSRTLRHLDTLSSELAANSRRIEPTLEQTGRLLEETRATLAAVREAARTFERTGAELGQLARAGSDSMAELSRGSLPQLNRTLAEVHNLTDHLSRLAAGISENPEMLLFGRPEEPAGPGE